VADADFIQPRSEAIARALDFFLAGDLGFAQHLHAGDLELLERTAAFELGRFNFFLAPTSAVSTDCWRRFPPA
jgi:hypothetical protein